MNNNIGLVILAAGKGTRMQEGLGNNEPKVLQSINGTPMIELLLNNINGANVAKPHVIVVGYGADQVQQRLGGGYEYVRQSKLLGTGHAVMQARGALRGYEHIVVLNGDVPLVSAKIVDDLARAHVKNNNVITVATLTVEDFKDYRSVLKAYGRVVRNESGNIKKIVEYKDADPTEKKIKELNAGYFCFNAKWLWDHLEKLDNKNAQGEFYLVDVVAMAAKEGRRIEALGVDTRSGLGANTPEDLKRLEEVINSA